MVTRRPPGLPELPPLRGIMPASLLDWDGEVAQVLFLAGCNWRCPFCHNPELVGREGEDMDWEEALAQLDRRDAWKTGVVVSGGEPTVHDSLAELCLLLKKRGRKVKLDTNGSRPAILSRLFEERLVDYVAMDLKTGFSDHAEVGGDAERVRKSMALLAEASSERKVRYEFRTTAVPAFVDVDALRELGSSMRGLPKWALQQFRPGRMLDSE
jgi:pyruvate formate lyase activating enzyme